nr:SymE family type I addiction module toxin [Providencia rettgeri]
MDKTTFSQCIQPVNITFSKRVFTSQTDFPDVRFFILQHFIKVPTAKEETAKSRWYSVGYLPNWGKPSPQLIISGKWLKELGFEVGSHYTLTRQAGQLIIRLAKGE